MGRNVTSQEEASPTHVETAITMGMNVLNTSRDIIIADRHIVIEVDTSMHLVSC